MNEARHRRVLVLGATGRFGSAAVGAFAAAGWQVLAQSRQLPKALPIGVQHVPAELADTATLVGQAASAEIVVHGVNPPYGRWAAEALPLARHAMLAAQRLNAAFMLPGNVYNFGEQMPPLLREDTPQRPSNEKGRIRCELESELENRATQGLSSVVIRAGDFFGAGTGSWIDLAIAKSLRKGKLVYPGPLDRAHAWAYLPDLARAFVAVAERPARGGAVFERFHFAGHTLTGSQLLDAIKRAARSLGIAPASGFETGTFPWPLIRAGGLVVPNWRGLAEMAYLWRVPHQLDATALEAAVGALQRTEIDAAMRETLKSLGFGHEKAAMTMAASKP